METFSWTKSVSKSVHILCENFSKIGPIMKKIPNFVNDPINYCNNENEGKIEWFAVLSYKNMRTIRLFPL